MPRTYTLRGKKVFDRLFKIGKRKSSKNFYIVYSFELQFKFACIVPKKNVKKATARNYSKRVMRDVLRTELLEFLKNNPVDIAIICKTDLKELKTANPDYYNDIKTELVNLIKSI